MNNKVVSIITPSFNRAYIVNETAESIFNQTYPHWEWVIVDDGSTDDSIAVLQQYAESDSRVKVLSRHREPKGACSCRNIAVENSTGDYLLFLDTDDLLAPFCLEQRVAAMETQPDADFIIFQMMLFHKSPDDLGVLWNIETGEDDLARILKNDAVCQGTGTLWKKDTFQRIGMWKEELKLWQDVELHIRSILWPVRITKRLDLQPDVFLRTSEDSLSRVGYNNLPKMQSRVQVFEYTCSEMKRKHVLDKYKEALKVMGLSIIQNAIKSGHFAEVGKLLQLCGTYQVLNKAEIQRIKQYKAVVQYKFSKIPVVSKYVFKQLENMIPPVENNIGRHKLTVM